MFKKQTYKTHSRFIPGPDFVGDSELESHVESSLENTLLNDLFIFIRDVRLVGCKYILLKSCNCYVRKEKPVYFIFLINSNFNE